MISFQCASLRLHFRCFPFHEHVLDRLDSRSVRPLDWTAEGAPPPSKSKGRAAYSGETWGESPRLGTVVVVNCCIAVILLDAS